MAVERTLSMIKPDAVAKNNIGQIYARFEAAGLQIVASRMLHLSKAQAQAFYAVHKERPFYDSLVEFMTSGPVVAAALERKDAVPYLRQVMGATDVSKAEAGTIRALYGTSIEENAIHGSDSPENAAIELNFFFSRSDLIGSR